MLPTDWFAKRNDELRELIEVAFSNARHPGSENLTTCPCDECAEIREYFADCGWRGHSVEQLRNVETALFHLSHEGFRYFLPAFCLAVLEDPDRAEAIPDLIVASVSPANSNFANMRVSLLSAQERMAVVRFLDYLVNSNIEEPDYILGARRLLTSNLR